MERRVTPPRRVTSPTWGPPPPCKQALTRYGFVAFDKLVYDRPVTWRTSYRSQNLLKLSMQSQRTFPKENTKNKPPSLKFSKIPRTWSFHVAALQRTAKKCTNNYNARAQLLFCSLNLLFCGVFVAVAVVVCLRFLFSQSPPFSKSFLLGGDLPTTTSSAILTQENFT